MSDCRTSNVERPCFCPPHPNYYNNAPPEQLQRQLQTGSDEVPLSRPTGTVLGLNDGCIFPPDHFAQAPSARMLASAAANRTPLRNEVRVAVVLVDFSDQQMSPDHNAAHFERLFFRPGGIGSGSVSEFYSNASGGNISLVRRVAGPFRMPHPKAYYANGDAGRGGSNGTIRPNTRDLGEDALTAAVTQFADLGDYDNDHNGYVDAFIVVHAGTGTEESSNMNDIWSVKWVLYRQRVVGRAKVYGFLTIPEDAQVGVCAHELGHLLFGWPDLYDIDYSSPGIGNWCVMAGGTWGGSPPGSRPCHPSAWCKAQQQWVTVVNETTNRPVSFQDVKTAHNVHRVWTNGDLSSQEYFLLEKRQQTGYDTSLPGEGLLIWHVDDAVPDNSNESHRKVDLMQADGLGQLYSRAGGRGDPGDPFPGSSNNRTFATFTNPSSRSYTGRDTGVAVSEITAVGAVTNTNIKVR
ncbi:M6 family metalloprotease domain-containing protein [Cladophialophora immunda]|nr:M6 family metalloprotease domain-containing protein [Cladophialophora immunda]